LHWLLRRTVRRYRAPALTALQRNGFGDLLQQGVWAISALAAPGLKISARDLVTRMDISKQAVSQLVDTLVAEGYVDRRPDTEDRRRTLLKLTPRGQAAARIIGEAVDEVESEMAVRIGDEIGKLHRLLKDLDVH
jgi:DNA-binding MarR family transcriptional regulator